MHKLEPFLLARATHSAPRMPPRKQPIDDVGRTVQRHLPPNARLHQYVPACTEGGYHGIQVSYGKSVVANIGIIFGWCTTKCRAYHGRPLPAPAQMSAEQRYRCMRALLALDSLPSGYDAQTFNAFCEAEAQKCRDLWHEEQHRNEHQSLAGLTATPSSAPSTISRTIRKAAPSSRTTKRPVGRPKEERRRVDVYLFTENLVDPTHIACEGVLDGPLVKFKSSQQAFIGACDRVFGVSCRPRLDLWDPALGRWIPAPKSTDIQMLLRGEGRLYKVRRVAFPRQLAHYRSLVLPDVERAVAGITPPPSSPPPTSPITAMRSSPATRRLDPFPLCSPPLGLKHTSPRPRATATGVSSAEFIQGSSSATVARKRAASNAVSTPRKKRIIGAGSSSARPLYIRDSDEDAISVTDGEAEHAKTDREDDSGVEDAFWAGDAT